MWILDTCFYGIKLKIRFWHHQDFKSEGEERRRRISENLLRAEAVS